jgi:Primase C terminal 2 (PriCT-2)
VKIKTIIDDSEIIYDTDNDGRRTNEIKKQLKKMDKSHFSKYFNEINEILTSVLPPLEGDKVTFIGSTFVKFGEPEPYLNHYHEHVFLKNKDEYLTEKQLDEDCPILIDIDFRYSYDVVNRIHTSKHIIDIVCPYLEELKTMYQFEKNTRIPVYIFEKDVVNRVETKQITKDGIHIIIGLKSDRVCQSILRKRILSKFDEIWGDLPIKNVNSWDDVFDEGITKGGTNWQLYGSKKPGNQPYKLSYIYDVCIDETDHELMYNPVCVKTFLTSDTMINVSARNRDNVFLFMDNAFVDEYDSKSVDKRKVLTSTSTRSISNHSCNVQDIQTKDMLNNEIRYFLESLKPDEYELREAYDYTMALPNLYYEEGSYTKWIRVGWALCNTDKRLFLVWVCLSAQQERFDYKCISDLWDKWKHFDNDNVNGLSSIHSQDIHMRKLVAALFVQKCRAINLDKEKEILELKLKLQGNKINTKNSNNTISYNDIVIKNTFPNMGSISNVDVPSTIIQFKKRQILVKRPNWCSLYQRE